MKIEERPFERRFPCNNVIDAFMPLRNPEKVLDVRYGLIRKIEQSYEIVFSAPEFGDV